LLHVSYYELWIDKDKDTSKKGHPTLAHCFAKYLLICRILSPDSAIKYNKVIIKYPTTPQTHCCTLPCQTLMSIIWKKCFV